MKNKVFIYYSVYIYLHTHLHVMLYLCVYVNVYMLNNTFFIFVKFIFLV